MAFLKKIWRIVSRSFILSFIAALIALAFLGAAITSYVDGLDKTVLTSRNPITLELAEATHTMWVKTQGRSSANGKINLSVFDQDDREIVIGRPAVNMSLGFNSWKWTKLGNLTLEETKDVKFVTTVTPESATREFLRVVEVSLLNQYPWLLWLLVPLYVFAIILVVVSIVGALFRGVRFVFRSIAKLFK